MKEYVVIVYKDGSHKAVDARGAFEYQDDPAYLTTISSRSMFGLSVPELCQDDNPEQLARFFHMTYESMAPDFGYRTREETAKNWADLPQNNKDLMIAVARQVIAHHEWSISHASEVAGLEKERRINQYKYLRKTVEEHLQLQAAYAQELIVKLGGVNY